MRRLIPRIMLARFLMVAGASPWERWYEAKALSTSSSIPILDHRSAARANAPFWDVDKTGTTGLLGEPSWADEGVLVAAEARLRAQP